MAEEAPKKTKKRKSQSSEAEEAPADERASNKVVAEQPKRSRAPFIWLVLLAIGFFELWVFGRNGEIRVCVAREGEHDFALADQPRDETNTRRYPSCERRFDLGLRGHYEERVEDAMLHACRRATILRGRDATIDCALERSGWQHRVEAWWVPPWQKEYYERLFWFLY